MSKPTSTTMPTSPQDQDPPGRPADPTGVDLTASKKPDAQPTEPHLPHERDQDMRMTDGNPDVQVEQAYADLQRGLQDTDKGPPSDDAYRKLKR